MGAVPARGRGPEQTAPTYFSRDLAGCFCSDGLRGVSVSEVGYRMMRSDLSAREPMHPTKRSREQGAEIGRNMRDI
jgi:hypothetical protein